MRLSFKIAEKHLTRELRKMELEALLMSMAAPKGSRERENHHTRWTAMGAQRYSDDALESIPCVLSAKATTPLWGRTALSCASFDIWTK
jgi:hypothetical protein